MRYVVALTMLATAGAASGQWVNSLAPRGARGPALRLASGGRSEYRIVLPSRPSPPERKAAADLQQWLATMCGVRLPIALEASGARRPAIYVGRTRALSQRVRPASDLADEGYGIAVVGKDLFLWGGRTRGPVNAVYALLEEDLGCRWYAKDSTRIPRMAELRLRPTPRTYVPQLRLRDPFYFASFDGVWSLRNRTNAPMAPVPEQHGGHIDYGGLFCHTFHQLVPPDRYFAEHPEYYMLDAQGKRNSYQLCTTDPGTIRVVTEAVLAAFRRSPNTELASVFKMDGGGICHCARCSDLRAAEGSDMACQLFMVNQVAAAVEKEFPRATIDTLAYLDTIGVPRTVRPRRNVAIRLCNDTVGAWTHPFTPAEQCDVAALARSWSAVCKRIYIWDYNTNFSHYLAPMPNMEVIAANIRFWVKNNAEGIMTQANYQTPGSERDEMRSWVIAKLMWDPSRDLRALMRDFTYGHYGKAASPIAAYDELLRAAGVQHAKALEAPPGGIRYQMDHPFLSRAFLDRASDLLAQAEKLADGKETLRRVERAWLPILYVKLARGPAFVGDTYPALLDRFERIARDAGVTHSYEGGSPNLGELTASWRKAWADHAPAQGTKR